MKRMLALMLLMSLMTVSCNSGGDSSSSEGSSQSTTEATADTSPVADADTTNPDADPVVTQPTPTPVVVAPTPEPEPEPEPEPVYVPAPAPASDLPALALSFSTNVLLYDFTSAQTEKYNKAIALVKKVVGTEAFRTKVLNHTYAGVKQFVDNGGKTNEQIYQSVLDAAERLTPAKNNTMDVGVKLYYENSSVVGYTSTAYTYINVNTKYFDTYTINNVAGNLFHEWLHKLGYSHSSIATTSRPYSVPYAIGYMISDLGRNFL